MSNVDKLRQANNRPSIMMPKRTVAAPQNLGALSSALENEKETPKEELKQSEEIKIEKPIEQPTDDNEKIVEEIIERANNKKEKKPEPQKRGRKKEIDKENTKTVAIGLYDQDDIFFLTKAGFTIGALTRTEHFAKLVENDFKSKEPISFRDEKHEMYRKAVLIQSNIPMTKETQEMLITQKNKHVLSNREYTAMLVHEARLNTPGWN